MLVVSRKQWKLWTQAKITTIFRFWRIVET